VIYTIGHSTHSLEEFIGLLKMHAITAVADVRSRPYSRFTPQFDREELEAALRAAGIRYVFLGKELGARSDDPACYSHGRVVYGRLAETPLFSSGLDRLLKGAQQFRICMMCAEKEPLDCHRTILVSRALQKQGVNIVHILADGALEEQPATMSRLMDVVGVPREDMFLTSEQLVDEACAKREKKIAYEDDELKAG
jgi:uncharacterized protein (DUF488 family)